ncbi:MAG: radical SAM protein, partial [Bacteroidales bacterium]|nr:radical SAM protein [Bacteroidales bacterium]
MPVKSIFNYVYKVNKDVSSNYNPKSEQEEDFFCDKLNPLAEFAYRFNAYSKLLIQQIKKGIPLFEIIRYRFPFLLPDNQRPAMLSIEFTNTCNLKCKYCANRLNVLKKGYMSSDIFSKIIYELNEKKVNRIHIVGNGEQTLHPDFFNYISELKKAAKYVDIVTNGQWNNNIADSMIKAKLDRIDISVDVGGKEHYEAVKEGAVYDKLISNLSYLYKIKKEYSPSTLIIIRLMLKPSKKELLGSELKFWKQYCDSVMIAPLCRFSHQEKHIDYD